MLRSSKELVGYVIGAKDGDVGHVKDVLFDERVWAVRYFVADTGKWLPGRRVLISPISVGEPDWESKRLLVDLMKEQVEKAPSLDSDAPVSRQYEVESLRYYGYAPYWVGPGPWGAGMVPNFLAREETPPGVGVTAEQGALGTTHQGDPSLRSADEVRGYHVQTTDGSKGHVDDFIIDDASWQVRYLVVDTRNWLPGRKVLVSPSWVGEVRWTERTVQVQHTSDEIKNAPEFDASAPVNRTYERRLYDFYGRPAYWDGAGGPEQR